MAKWLNVNLRFNADSSSARREIEALQTSLQRLIATSYKSGDLKLEDDIRRAT
jgi:hypothetical protein